MFSISLIRMSKKIFLPVLILMCCQFTTKANFFYDSNCIEAYKAIIGLRLPEARILIQKEKQQNPQNGIIILLENTADYFNILLSSESKNDFEKLNDIRSDRISALEDNDKNSPFCLFAQAEIYMQSSFLRAKFSDYVSSGFDAKKAANLLKENAKKYPDFLPNQKSLALVNVIFGSIPAGVRGFTRFLGMNGDASLGIKQLEQLRTDLPKSKYGFYTDEVIFYLCNINIDARHNYAAYPKLISYLDELDKNSLLRAYLMGHIAAKSGHNDDAIRYLEARPKGLQYMNLPAIDYQLGISKLSRMDNDANLYLEKYVNEFKGINYIKDACLKLAFFYLLQNNQDKYNNCIALVKAKGHNSDERDKEALSESYEAKPDLDVLKARLYFDGGYNDKALNQLLNKDANKLTILRDKIEYYYRLGRVYDKTDKPTEALLNYQRTINVGKNSNLYYIANAALNMGRIYEEKHDFKKAAEYYQQTLDMKAHEYQSSIDNDAKEGLKRVSK